MNKPLPVMLREAALLIGEIRLLADVHKLLSPADRDRLRQAQQEINQVRKGGGATLFS